MDEAGGFLPKLLSSALEGSMTLGEQQKPNARRRLMVLWCSAILWCACAKGDLERLGNPGGKPCPSDGICELGLVCDTSTHQCVTVGTNCVGEDCTGRGTCQMAGQVPECICDVDYHAMDLECVSDADPCDGIDCSGNGVCVETGGNASCNCDLGYHAVGLNCEDGPCVPETDGEFCVRLNRNCDEVSGIDNCRQARTVTSCGNCTQPLICGGRGEANVCGDPFGTAATRPGYNTGVGFFVLNGKLYDANGVEFRIRGVNKLHWDADSPGIPKTGSNTTRWVIDFSRPAASNVALIQRKSIDHDIVPMPSNWRGTCDNDRAILTSIVDAWIAQISEWRTIERYMILNIANEWGPSDSTDWRDAYVTAITRLRTAGYLATIAVDAGGCGQNLDDLTSYAQAVFDSDPQKNVIFDQHIYGMWATNAAHSWQHDLTDGFDRLAALGLPVVIGEFGPGRNIGPSGTTMTPGTIIQNSEARGFGWLAWAWDDPAYNANDEWFAMSYTGDYNSSADLTIFGKEVVEDTSYGLLVLAQPATVF